MTTVSGVLRDAKGMALPGVAVTLRYVPAVIGYSGGAVAQNNLTYLTSSAGLLTMPGLVAGPYDLSIAMPIGTSAAVTAAVTARLVVNGEATQTLEDALQTTIGEITPTILSLAIAAADRAEAAAANAQSSARLLELRGGTVAQLLADTTLNQAVVPVGSVIEAGGFRYEVAASDASDHHIATAGGVKLYVLPGANGFDVRAFGAVGDGVADDSAAFQAAMDAAVASENSAIYAPSGRYLLGSVCEAIVGNAAHECGLTFSGDGPGATHLVAASWNNNGLLRFVDSVNQTSFHIHGFSCLSVLDKTDDAGLSNGTAIFVGSLIDATDPAFGDRAAYGAIIENVHIAGDGANSGDTGSRGRWTRGIDVENTWYPIVRQCHVRTVGADVGTHGVRFLDCYDPRCFEVYVRGPWDCGIWHDTVRAASAASYEGGYVSRCTIVGSATAIYIGHQTEIPLYEPGFHITDCHINPDNYGVRIFHHRQIVIDGVYFYVSTASRATELLPASIFLEKASDVLISGCQFLERGFFVSEANASVGVLLGDGTNGVMIDGCAFNHGGIGILNNSTATANRNVAGNNLCRAGQSTGSWAAFTYIVDEAGTLAEAGLSQSRNTFEIADATADANLGGIVLKRKRSDYASNPTGVLSGIDVNGLNASGDEVRAVQIKTLWNNNAAGSETALMEIYQRRAGSLNLSLSLMDDGRVNMPVGVRTGGSNGVTGSFTTADGKTITVKNGIITSIA